MECNTFKISRQPHNVSRLFIAGWHSKNMAYGQDSVTLHCNLITFFVNGIIFPSLDPAPYSPEGRISPLFRILKVIRFICRHFPPLDVTLLLSMLETHQ